MSQIRNVADLQDFLRAHDKVHIRGFGSKPALHQVDAAVADMSGMRGILEYLPDEYTVTVAAGSPIAEIAAALAEEGQYLPFDPLLPDRASIGGAVAANLAGSRRFRYGGIRDFILGAAVVDGLGRAFTVGGKVVKNAAGFDLPKFLVGSLGHYAIMTELTFKVFPDVPHFRSLQAEYSDAAAALEAVYWLNQQIYELDALDMLPSEGGMALLLRLGGFAETLPRRIERLTAALQAGTALKSWRELAEAPALWEPLAGLTGAHVIKLVLPPKLLPDLESRLGEARRRYSVGGNIAWVGTDDLASLEAALMQLGLTGLCLRGQCESPIIGKSIDNPLARRVKQVLDPQGKLV